jgi:hypothetical protein
MSDDKLTVEQINKRLTELNKEFKDLGALKKELLNEAKREKLKEKYSEFKYKIEPGGITNLDLDEVADRDNMVIGQNSFGLPVFAYDYGQGSYHTAIAKTEEEAEFRKKADKLLSVAHNIEGEFNGGKQPNKTYSPEEIVKKFVDVLEGTDGE